MDSFREQIQKAMDDKQWSTLELSEASGVTRAYIYRVLDGKVNPSMEIADKLAKPLGLVITTIAAK